MFYKVSKDYFGISSIFNRGVEVDDFVCDLSKSLDIQLINLTLLLGKGNFGIVFKSEDQLIGFLDDLLYCFEWVENEKNDRQNIMLISTFEESVNNFKRVYTSQKSFNKKVETDSQIENKMIKFKELEKLLSKK